ncbi:conserved hypothetical protein [Pediculus humanus corporis]|uniref:Methyltransferase domain-containing protein n=1 Tax=Pediculus humanus subsp. corporis TaxID=121224 RepID=E0VAH1_PEDHC|nr:uncharacterized protein Phum_PHUM037810 [Pediculus humanus corporis]EEB10377.1 conserved hypothetical protein [Pediculus humanus corporis]
MHKLCLEVFSNVDKDGTCFVPLETIICLFIYIYCDCPPVPITLVITNNDEKKTSFKINTSGIEFKIVIENEMLASSNICKLPVLISCNGTSFIGGLCGVLRQLIKIIDEKHSLLGFKQNCLYACAESSLWTKFCEVDMTLTINHIIQKQNLNCDLHEIPVDLVRFENHMMQPVKIHNIEKKKQDIAKEKKKKSLSVQLQEKLNLSETLEHKFSDGLDMTLEDLILFPSFYILFKCLTCDFFKNNLPFTFKWYMTMLENDKTEKGLLLFAENVKVFKNVIDGNYTIPKVEKESFYKGEYKKKQPKRHFYTKQEEIEKCLEIVNEIKIDFRITSDFGEGIDFDWGDLPSEVCLGDNQIPIKRLEKKNQQLKSMIKAILKIAKNGDRIVDFCSGSGHLGLTLAHLLPTCTIVLIENKEQSLNRAKDRAYKLKLFNVIFCQSNLDYFKGNFNIGVSLHACGVATDLVIERCIEEKAAFISCPCCYGSIQPNHVISYPRSRIYQNSQLTVGDYFVLAHSSDQTHDDDNAKTIQGFKCMMAIDSDRCLRAQEANYTVFHHRQTYFGYFFPKF